MKVAVVGAGPAGLVSARELLRHQCDIVVYESTDQVGGVWVYDEQVDDDPLGVDCLRPVRSSLYETLRTNLPRDLMAFLDYPFDSNGGGDNAWDRYPHHSLVRTYLENFANDYDLNRHIRLNTPVTRLHGDPAQNKGWEVESAAGTELFDAVIVCNGHYAKPRVVPLSGIEYFKGQRLHSHNYRSPRGFKDKTVALWGTSASGFDISNEIASVATRAYWCGSAFSQREKISDNLTALPSPRGFSKRGDLIVGEDEFPIDVLMYCTGYLTEFPFLSPGIVSVTDNWVHPLYRDILPPTNPTIGFIGLPYLIVPFPIFEIQAKWFTRQLTGQVKLPDQGTRERSVNQRTREFQQATLPHRHYHKYGEQQFDYYNELAQECGVAALPNWFIQTWLDARANRERNPVDFRDQPLPVRGPTICQ
jgi:hypothetical protein